MDKGHLQNMLTSEKQQSASIQRDLLKETAKLDKGNTKLDKATIVYIVYTVGSNYCL